MSGHWHSYPAPEEAAQACSRHIFGRLESALAGEGDATVAISGGSTPKLLFEVLSKTRFDWSRVHLFWVDERAVPPNHPESNFKLAEDHLIVPGHIPRRNLHRICSELPPDKAAKRYTEEIRDFFEIDKDELPHFDVIHLGIGSDAHTASLFPGEPLIEERSGIAAAVFVEKLQKWRITLLPGVLLAARHTAFLVAGADKKAAVHAIFKQGYEPLKFPAQTVAHHGRAVTWFLDEAAAEGIQL